MRRWLVCLVFLLLASAAQADLAAGLLAVARRDYAAAFKAFKPLAEKGEAAAQVNLGNLYLQGLGAQRNESEALRWYRLAAEQGERIAQSKLGLMYYQGLGTAADPTEAARWFRLAAERGDLAAQTILATLLANGEGVPRDRAQAYYWYVMALEHGDKQAGKGRDSLEEEMTPGEKDEASRLLAEERKRAFEADEQEFEQTVANIKPPSAQDKTAAQAPAIGPAAPRAAHRKPAPLSHRAGKHKKASRLAKPHRSQASAKKRR